MARRALDLPKASCANRAEDIRDRASTPEVPLGSRHLPLASSLQVGYIPECREPVLRRRLAPSMPPLPILRLGSVKDPAVFLDHLKALGLDLPFDHDVILGDASPLAAPAEVDGLRIGNLWTIHPMEGWDGT